jgi:hypothetical protein
MKDDYIRPKEEPTVPPWVRRMLRSKAFWAFMVAFIFFMVLWQREGIGWAVGTLVVAGFIALFVFDRRRVRRHYYDEDDEGEDVTVERRRHKLFFSEGTRDLYIPKVDSEFYVPKASKGLYIPRRKGK